MAEDTRSSDALVSVAGADIRTFLLADIRGYTRFTQEHGDDAASTLAGRFADLVRDTVPLFEGELLELRGDEALCVFRSARQALRASVDLQRRLRTATEDAQAFPLGVGMGLDAGEAVATQGGYRGGSLNLAARLCSLAGPGQILASETVSGLAGRVDGIRFVPRRAVRVKGIDAPVRPVEVVSEQPLPPLPQPQPTRPDRGWVRRHVILVGSAFTVAVGVAVGVAVTHGNAPVRGVSIRPDSVMVIDPHTHRVVADLRVGRGSSAIAAGNDAVYVANMGDTTITRIDPKTLRPSTTGVQVTPTDLAAGTGKVFVYDGATATGVALDPLLRTSVRFGVPRHCSLRPGPGLCTGGGLAIGDGRVWVASGREDPQGPPTVWGLNPASLTLETHIPNVYAETLAWGAGHLWAYGGGGQHAAVIDTHANRVVQRFSLNTSTGVLNSPQITTADGTGWAVSPLGDVYILGTDTSVHLSPGLYGAASSGSSVWVTSGAGYLYQVSAYQRTVTHTYRLRYPAQGVAVAYGKVWVTLGNGA